MNKQDIVKYINDNGLNNDYMIYVEGIPERWTGENILGFCIRYKRVDKVKTYSSYKLEESK